MYACLFVCVCLQVFLLIRREFGCLRDGKGIRHGQYMVFHLVNSIILRKCLTNTRKVGNPCIPQHTALELLCEPFFLSSFEVQHTMHVHYAICGELTQGKKALDCDYKTIILDYCNTYIVCITFSAKYRHTQIGSAIEREKHNIQKNETRQRTREARSNQRKNKMVCTNK